MRWYDAAGRETRGETRYDDGQRETYVLDAGNTASWSRVGHDYDASGALLRKSVQYDDGRSVTTDYQPGSTAFTRTTQGTADGVYKMEFVAEDGSRDVLRYRDDSDGGWNTDSRHYNADGEVTLIYNRFGLDSFTQHFDAGDHLAWSRYAFNDTYRDDGVQTTTLSFDEGGRLVTGIDRPGWGAPEGFPTPNPWAAQGRVTDARDELAWRYVVNDDGTVREQLGQLDWQVRHDACGCVTERSADLGNGVTLLVDYDTARTENWSAQVTLRDAAKGADFYAAAFTDDGGLQVLLSPSQPADWIA
ncbi:hypothetical protein [Teichococcus oryzae]|uniref:RHS repeat protein n=1 Tax=Teichococcus oryzae TaxID=1608942 RepID=A0A5B2THJ6_9PROT|nr:hypothetical protein [Pseudoroseomonas oryzae]KAA2213250.1 hypothetical protein F0Q34_11550 [Pseudoroseomonas oryzae]